MQKSKNKWAKFEDFVKKSKIKDRMAAGFWYQMFMLSELSLDKWLKGSSKAEILT